MASAILSLLWRRVMPAGENHTVRSGPFELDSQCGELRKSGIRLKLQGQPIQILEILLQKPGQLVTREEIRQRLWTSDTFVDFDHSLNTAVKKLRQTLGDEADTPRYIETLPKRGYRFIGEVAPAGPKDETPKSSLPTVVPTEPGDSHRLASEGRPQRRKAVVGMSAFVLLVIVSGAVVYSAIKPLPHPRIVGSHALTKTRNRKLSFQRPLIDRGSIYFGEERPSGYVTLQVPIAGGEVSEGPAVNGDLDDISRDGSQLLFNKFDHERSQDDIWTQPFPSGVPRLIVKDVGNWEIWSADGQSIFFTRSKENKTELYRANADGTGEERLGTTPESVQPHLSPDGTHIRATDVSRGLATMWEVGTDGRNGHTVLAGRQDAWGGIGVLTGNTISLRAGMVSVGVRGPPPKLNIGGEETKRSFKN